MTWAPYEINDLQMKDLETYIKVICKYQNHGIQICHTVEQINRCNQHKLVSVNCWDPLDCSPPGSSVHGILQARILSGLPFPSPGDLSNLGIKPRSPALQANSLPLRPPGRVLFKHGISLVKLHLFHCVIF